MKPRMFLACLVAPLLLVSGCTSGGTAPDDTPQFKGRWAMEFEDAYHKSTTDVQRQALSDEKITDAEYQELMHAFETCVTGSGLKLSWNGTNGGFRIYGDVPQDEQDRLLNKCTEDTEGSVTMLYRSIKRNPDNLDERTIMAACLVRVGVVDKNYTAKDYERDFLQDPPPAYFDDALFNRCNSDPLGARA